jgi:hypothetical protein
MLKEEIQKEGKYSKQANTVIEEDHDDLVTKEEARLKAEKTDRSAKSGPINESFPGFRSDDVMVPLDLETGRTDL